MGVFLCDVFHNHMLSEHRPKLTSLAALQRSIQRCSKEKRRLRLQVRCSKNLLMDIPLVRRRKHCKNKSTSRSLLKSQRNHIYESTWSSYSHLRKKQFPHEMVF